MKQDDPLHTLIHSMDANEKGYFKKYAQLFTSPSDSVYYQLFDVLNKMNEYSEAVFLKKLKNPRLLKNLPVLKHQLTDMILKSLRSYHENKRLVNEFDALYFEADLLLSRGLTDLALKKLAKCKQLAHDMDDPIRELQVIDWERRFVSERKPAHLNELLTDSFRESYAAIDRIKMQTQLREYYLNLFRLVRQNISHRNIDAEKETAAMMSDPLIRTDEELPGFYAQLNKLNCWNLYYHLQGDQQKMGEYARMVIELWNRHPAILGEYQENYLYGLGNYVVALAFQNKYREIKKYIDNVETLKLKTANVKRVYYEVVTLWKLTYAFMSGDEAYLRSMIEFVESSLDEYKTKINPMNTLVIRYGLVRMYFIVMEYKKALLVINDILDMKKIDLRMDIQSNARVYNMLVHYELGNEEMLEYLSKNSRRYLESNDHYYEYEKMLFGFFNRLIKSDDKDEKVGLFHDLSRQLDEFIGSNASEVLLFNSTELVLWLRSKLTGRSMLDVYRELSAS